MKIFKYYATGFIVLFLLTGCEGTEHKADTLYNEDYINRPIEDDLFYFVMTDRFSNGDTSNDQGSLTQPIFSGGFDKTSDRKFHGGDLAGLKDKLDYIKGLGVTALWMTPFMGNKASQGDVAGYHGYWIVDFMGVDPHMGTTKDLKELIKAAHERGIKVFFDIVVNHTADVIKYQECDNCPYKTLSQMEKGDKYTPFLPAGEENVKVPAWLNDLENYSNQGDSSFTGESVLHGDFAGLDDIKTADPDVRAGMIDIFKYLISEYKPDGFRIDTAKYVKLDYWQNFMPIILQYAREQGIPNFHIFGEVQIHQPAALSQYTTEGMLPSVLDFPFLDAMKKTFAGTGATNILKSLFDQDHFYTDEDSNALQLMTYIGNHDDGRFAYFINRDLPEASAEEKFQRLKLAHAFMIFARGIPILYYGAEQGFTGAGLYEGSREDMMPSQVDRYNAFDLMGTEKTTADDNFDPGHPLYQAFRKYAELYHEHSALRRGDHKTLYATDEAGIYAFSRTDPEVGQEYLLLFNLAPVAKTATISVRSGQYTAVRGKSEILADADQNITITVAPFDFIIYKSNVLKGNTE